VFLSNDHTYFAIMYNYYIKAWFWTMLWMHLYLKWFNKSMLADIEITVFQCTSCLHGPCDYDRGHHLTLLCRVIISRQLCYNDLLVVSVTCWVLTQTLPRVAAPMTSLMTLMAASMSSTTRSVLVSTCLKGFYVLTLT